MKSIKQLGLFVALLSGMVMHAQSSNETIKEELQFPTSSADNLLVVNNIEGFVKVEGYSGNTVQIEGNLRIIGNNQRQLDQAKSELSMKVAAKDDIIYVYLDSPDIDFNVNTGRYEHNQKWSNKRYKYDLDITVKVPRNTNIEISAINGGVAEARNIDAKTINVSNINGAITLENISGKTYANALNKDINISYSKNPTEESTFKSLNGDINLQLKEGLNADVSFKGLNGNIYTNMETKISPSKSDMKKRKGNRGTKYKMNSNTNFSIGNGGVQLNFDVLNGDVTLKS